MQAKSLPGLVWSSTIALYILNSIFLQPSQVASAIKRKALRMIAHASSYSICTTIPRKCSRGFESQVKALPTSVCTFPYPDYTKLVRPVSRLSHHGADDLSPVSINIIQVLYRPPSYREFDLIAMKQVALFRRFLP